MNVKTHKKIWAILLLIVFDYILIALWQNKINLVPVNNKENINVATITNKQNNTNLLHIKIVIPSFCDAEEYILREMQRRSWLRYMYDSEWEYKHICDVQYHYIIGNCSNKTLNDMLLNEMSKYNDIIRINFQESWNNLAKKTIEMLLYEYIDHKNYQYDILFKTDTDSYVNIPILCSTIKDSKYKYEWNFQQQAIYSGRSNDYENTIRAKQLGHGYYTRYMEGHSYFLSYKAVEIIYNVFIYTKNYMAYNKIEDAYLGHALSLFNITFYNVGDKISSQPQILKQYINKYISDHMYVGDEAIKMVKKYKTHKRMVQEQKKKVRISNNEITIKDNIIGNSEWLNWYLKEQKNKLLYCYIPKNICTIFKSLLFAMTNNQNPKIRTDIHGKMFAKEYSNNSVQFIQKNMKNSNSLWKSLIVIRDPLERLLSGYLDKCLSNDNESKRFFNRWCYINQTTKYNFTMFANRIVSYINNNKSMYIEHHFRPQYTFCGFNEKFIQLKDFDHIIYYHKETISNETLTFMRNIGIDINTFYYNWGIYHNESMFNTYSSHATRSIVNNTDSIANKIEFYSKYYDTKLAQKVYNAFYIDYKMLNIHIPKWMKYLSNINYKQLVTTPLLRKNPSSIIYIKTYKTGGSTITNLLHTYTVRHNKSCLIISNKIQNEIINKTHLVSFHFDENKDKMFVLKSIKNRYTWNRNKSLNVWLNHVINNPFLFELIPSSKHQAFTILREPNQRLLSALYFYRGRFKFNRYNYNISDYINVTTNLYKLANSKLGFNSMCKSLIPGFIKSNKYTNKSWKEIISGDFLLLINERFDESLLLLKYAYNMSWSDLVFRSMKVRNNHAKYVLTVKEDIALKELLKCDWKLYNMAQRIFDYRLYQIYKGNKTKILNDINTMKYYQYKQQLLCNSLNGSNSMYIDHDQLVCQSIQLDDIEWNLWASNYNEKRSIINQKYQEN